jgi:hypothetical protein
MKLMPYTDDTANGLTKCMVDWVIFSGGNANRINVKGQIFIPLLLIENAENAKNIFDCFYRQIR